ncbi:hypothetical protein RBB78_16270 [Tunturiibacter empetritectus]|uniref:hypothetical protein n=1 Tax=Tunturiibacter empetritectus TaxID=3069691 RepID=UPI003D9AEDDA
MTVEKSEIGVGFWGIGMKFFRLVFGGFCRGFREKTWFSLWCFGGEDVVRCVVKVVF